MAGMIWGDRHRRRVWPAALTAVLVLGACADDEEPSATSAPTPTTAVTSTTAAPTTSAPATTVSAPTTAATTAPAPGTTAPATTTPPAVDTATAVWPTAGAGVRYTDPVAAARGFATELVGFEDPIVGEFRAGDSRSGEVEIRAREQGPVTTVLVRQLSGSDDWWVLGCATGNIELTSPAPMDTISSPVRLQGTSTAFEATVNVLVVSDASTEPLGEGFVMGGANGELGPFDGTIEFAAPTAPMGALILLTYSAEDGRVTEASVVRIALA
jgi:hypothetical protein